MWRNWLCEKGGFLRLQQSTHFYSNWCQKIIKFVKPVRQVENIQIAKIMENNLRNDSRFAHIATDPRFRRIPKSERKVKIDKRFQSMFSDEKFKLKYSFDKRGRPASHTTSDDLRRYYDLASDESEDSESDESETEDEKEEVKTSNKKCTKGKNKVAFSKQDEDSDEGKSSEEASDEELHSDKEDTVPLSNEIKEKIRNNKVDYARGDGVLLSDSSSDEESSENESEVDIREMDHEWGELDRDAERTDDITHRLAVCNMDWDRIRASDLMVLFNSFMPPGGIIHSVTIYPSEFGLERMKHDELAGPAELLADDPKDATDFNKEGLPPDDENEEGEKFNMERLRQYQLTRLRYYYAVVVFDSPESANKIYLECDGTEYESSSGRLDLRFVPDDTTFDQEPKDSCERMPEPSKYEPLRFTTSALHQGKVQLTWDETDPYRVEASNRIAAGTADEADLQAFIASSSGEEDEEDEDDVKAPKIEETAAKPGVASISKYRALLSGIEEEEKTKDTRDVELEVTWGLDLKKKASKLVKQKLKDGPDGPTPFQQMIEKRNEKKRKKREEKRLKKAPKAPEDEDGGAISDDDIPSDIDMNDPYFKEENKGISESKKKKEKKKKIKKLEEKKEEDNEEETKKKAELELLLMESDDDRQHFSLQQILETEKATSGKKKKKSKWTKPAKPVVEDNFEIDVNDDRFSALFSSHHFNIDPTDSRYRKTNAMESLLSEKFKRKLAEEKDGQKQQKQGPAKKAKKSKGLDSELTDLVATLKKKTAGRFTS